MVGETFEMSVPLLDAAGTFSGVFKGLVTVASATAALCSLTFTDDDGTARRVDVAEAVVRAAYTNPGPTNLPPVPMDLPSTVGGFLRGTLGALPDGKKIAQAGKCCAREAIAMLTAAGFAVGNVAPDDSATSVLVVALLNAFKDALSRAGGDYVTRT
jgi:hypothetical protein